MGIPEKVEAKLQKQHQELSRALNLDKTTANETWKNFKKVYDPVMLDGDPLHWLGCALFVSCKSSLVPTVSKSNIVVQGNQVSLDRLLRSINLNVTGFFNKIGIWVSKQELQPNIKESISKLERVFNVSMILFKKFQVIYYDLFNKGNIEPKTHKSKKPRKPLPDVSEIFDFTWALFLLVKSNFPSIVDDLVNSYPLLLSSCDFIYANVLISNRKEIIKNNYANSKNKYSNMSDVPCIIDKLCEKFDGKPIEIKSTKEYFWRKQVKVLFEKNILKGNPDLLSSVLEPSIFEQNFKSINKHYEEFVLSSGSLDERLFISGLNDIVSEDLSGKEDQTYKESVEKQEEKKVTPNLKNLLSSRPLGPGENLKQYNSTQFLEKTVSNLSLKLMEKLLQEEDKPSTKECENIVALVNKMFYKLLDSIISFEVKKPAFDAEKLLTQEIMLKTLFACAFEIITFTLKLDKNFPWILETLELNPLHFYKIIEVVVRTEDVLKREVVWHLNVIEETILESLAWKKDSPLWKALIESSQPIPSSEEVIVTPVFSDESQDEENMDGLAGKTNNLIYSPGAPLADKFLSPRKRPISEVGSNESEPSLKLIRMDKRTAKPKRTGSVALFFRKFYYLASVRLKDMCNQLRLLDPVIRMKIWTFFEQTIVQYGSLMLDRHLDQILMCSIYVIGKIVSKEITFMSMMKSYRNQPQSKSHVYRNVLLKPNYTLEQLKNNHRNETPEENGDIIKFYNEVYIHIVKELTKKFRCAGDSENLVLSPIPNKRSTPVNGPKRILESIPVYLSEHKRFMSPNSKTINYYFARSPAKDLKEINRMVSHEMIPKISKQMLNDDQVTTAPNPRITQKVKDLFAERLTIETQELDDTSNQL